MTDRDAYRRAAYEVIAAGIAPEPGPSYPLAEVAPAHRELADAAVLHAVIPGAALGPNAPPR